MIGAPIAPDDSLDVPPPLPDSATIEQVALANRPELAILQSQQQGAHATTSLAEAVLASRPHDRRFSATTRSLDRRSSPTGIALPLPTFYWQHARGDIAQAQHRRARARRDVPRRSRPSHARRSLGIRQREHAHATGRLPPRPAGARGARGLSRRVDELRARRLVGARGARRRAALCSTRRASSPTHSPTPTPPAPISIARSALLSPRSERRSR